MESPSFPDQIDADSSGYWVEQLWAASGRHFLSWTARVMFAERIGAMLRTFSPLDMLLFLTETQRASQTAVNPSRAAYAIVDKLDAHSVRAALESRTIRLSPDKGKTTEVNGSRQARKEYLAALIADSMGRPQMPKWTGSYDDVAWSQALHAAAEWDKAHRPAVEDRLEWLLDLGQEMVTSGHPVHVVRAWVEARAKESEVPRG